MGINDNRRLKQPDERTQIAFDSTLGGTLPSRTKQSFKDECDVNLVVRRYAQTGMWTHLNPATPTFGDFSGAVDLQTAIELVREADNNFAKLPARVRQLVDNDPVQFLHALAVPELFQELIAAGLPTETKTTVIPTSTSSTPAPESGPAAGSAGGSGGGGTTTTPNP